MARARDGYLHSSIDGARAVLWDRLVSDIIHIRHLKHLSTSKVIAANKRGILFAFTLHDCWLLRPNVSPIECTLWTRSPKPADTTESVPSEAASPVLIETLLPMNATHRIGSVGWA